MKFKTSLMAGVFAAALLAASAVPAYAYEVAYGYRSCTGVKAVSLYGTQNDQTYHWYFDTNTLKVMVPTSPTFYYWWQTYSSSSSSSWEIQTDGSFQPSTSHGATCV